MEGGYDYEVVGEVLNGLNCVICLKLMRDPIQMECTHGMCNVCFEKLAQSSLERYFNKIYIFYHKCALHVYGQMCLVVFLAITLIAVELLLGLFVFFLYMHIAIYMIICLNESYDNNKSYDIFIFNI